MMDIELPPTRNRLSAEQYEQIYAEAQSGQPISEVAKKFGISYSLVTYVIKKGGKRYTPLHLRPGRVVKAEKNVDRGRPTIKNQKIFHENVDKIIQLYLEGVTLTNIGKQYGVTRERIRQILLKSGVDMKAGGAHKHMRDREIAVERYRVERFIEKAARWGMTTEEYFEHTQKWGTSSDLNSPMSRFIHHKKNLTREGSNLYEWNFTFKEWWAAWEKSGKWNKRGRGSYSMRVRDHNRPIGPDNYEIWNIKGGNRKHYHGRDYSKMCKQWGLSVEEYTYFLNTYGGTNVPSSPFNRYSYTARRVVKEYGAEAWKISFKDWWKLWEDSGCWTTDRMLTVGMFRVDKTKPFEIGNLIVRRRKYNESA